MKKYIYKFLLALIMAAHAISPATYARTEEQSPVMQSNANSSVYEDELLAQRRKEAEDSNQIGEIGAGILILLLLMMVGGYIFSVKTRIQEKKRRWVKLPLPDCTESSKELCLDNLRSEFCETLELISSLQKRECDGVMLPCITEKREIDTAYEILHRLKKLPNLNTDEILHLNILGEQANEAQARHICCDKRLYRIAFLFGGFMCRDAFLMPLYKFNNPDPLYIRLAQSFTMAFGIGGFVEAYKHANGEYEPIYVDRKGRFWKRAGLEPVLDGCMFAVIISFLTLILTPFVLYPCAIAHMYRNYFSNR